MGWHKGGGLHGKWGTNIMKATFQTPPLVVTTALKKNEEEGGDKDD